MHIDHNPYISELDWQQARPYVSHANLKLAQLIDNINPAKEFTLLKVKYPYGEFIFEKGTMKLPNHLGQFVSAHDSTIPAVVRKLVDYSPVPMTLIATHTAEIYVEPPNRLVPLTIFNAGTLFGSWETLDTQSPAFMGQLWNVAAGSRSIFFLPKISDALGHSRLKRSFNLSHFTPHHLRDQWHIFKELAKHPDFPEKWHCEILFFTNKWLACKQQDSSSLEFYLYIFQTAWRQSLHWRVKMYFELIWEGFALEIFNQNLKPKTYVIDTLKHLIYIASGTFPGFIPAIDNSVAPCSAIQRIYLDIYGLKHYYPTLLHLHHLENTKDSVYYSLQFPTIIDYSKTMRKPASAMSDLHAIKQLMTTLQQEFTVEDKFFANFMHKVQCHYYHSDPDPFGDAIATSKIIKHDKRFMELSSSGQEFAATGTFLRGCVAISLRK